MVKKAASIQWRRDKRHPHVWIGYRNDLVVAFLLLVGGQYFWGVWANHSKKLQEVGFESFFKLAKRAVSFATREVQP